MKTANKNTDKNPHVKVTYEGHLSVSKWEKETGALKTETHKSYTQTLPMKLELISETECFVWFSQAKGIGADKETYL